MAPGNWFRWITSSCVYKVHCDCYYWGSSCCLPWSPSPDLFQHPLPGIRDGTSVLAPTPSPWYSIESLGENSLFLGQNYLMMVKGDPAAVDTTLLPFMRRKCIYTLDIAVVPYPGPDTCRFSLDDQSCVALDTDNSWPFPEHLWLKQAFPTPRIGLVEVHFIPCYLLCDENFSI